MPVQSRWRIPVPETSLPTWVFGSSNGPLPDRNAFVDAGNPTRALSFADFRRLAKKVAVGLQRAGIQPGHRVLLYSANDLLFPALFYGVVMAGAIFTGANPAFTSRELAYQLKDSEASIMIASTSVLDVALDAAQTVGLPQDCIYAFDGSLSKGTESSQRNVRHWSELVASDGDAQAFNWVEPEDVGDATCCLNYSSGTTGSPKGVEVTHYGYVANGVAAMTQHGLQYEAWGGTYDQRALCMMPMYHAAAQTTYLVGYAKTGTPTYIMQTFNFERMLQHIQDFQITDVLVAPPIVIRLAKSPACRKYDLSSVRSVVSGTAAMPLQVANQASELWEDDRVQIQSSWGMTEVTCIGLLVDPRHKVATGAVGEVVANASLKLMADGREVTEPGQRGELWFSGPAVMKGYWRNPRATAETIAVDADGVRWLKTGDIGYYESYAPGAHLHIVDRVKELIKVKGYQVAPAELEALLLTRPDVADAGVIGVPVEGSEAPRAYIVRAPGSSLTADEVHRWLRDKVAPYKRLTGGVAFVDAIPRVQSGKILRRVLREMAKQESAASTVKAKLA